MSDFSDELLWHYRTEQFYYLEARLLDQRRYREWQQLLSPDIEYIIPARWVPQHEREDASSDALHSPEKELSQDQGNHYRQDDFLTLCLRSDRALKPFAWAENPPPRTTRLISNIEIKPEKDGKTLSAMSNFILHFNRHHDVNTVYTGHRSDRLAIEQDALKLLYRRVILNTNLIEAPTLNLVF